MLFYGVVQNAALHKRWIRVSLGNGVAKQGQQEDGAHKSPTGSPHNGGGKRGTSGQLPGYVLTPVNKGRVRPESRGL